MSDFDESSNSSRPPKSPQSDDLRTRIAAATVGHADYVSAGIRYCTCGQWAGDSSCTRMGFAQHVADAVIRELGLRRQPDGEDSIELCVPTQHHRYLTEWTPDE